MTEKKILDTIKNNKTYFLKKETITFCTCEIIL